MDEANTVHPADGSGNVRPHAPDDALRETGMGRVTVDEVKELSTRQVLECKNMRIIRGEASQMRYDRGMRYVLKDFIKGN
jgi:hypothetical protein